jgi:pSer/pThr/pTyr-binding forkhead associated (FHA) protein
VRARLFAKTGHFAGASFEIGSEATIGRIDGNSVVLSHKLISSRHGRIYFDTAEGSYRLEDLGSVNGCAVDGVRVRESEKLGRLELITLAGQFDFVFQVLDAAALASAPAVVADGAVRAARGATVLESSLDMMPLVVPGQPAAPSPARTVLDSDLGPVPGSLPGAAAKGEPGRTVFESDLGGLPPSLDEAAQQAAARATMLDSTIGDVPSLMRPALGVTGAKPAVASDPGSELPTAAFEPVRSPLPAGGIGAGSLVSTTVGALRPVTEVSSAPFTLRLLLMDGATESFNLTPGEHWIGRGEASDLRVKDASLSRRHARLLVSASGVRLMDPGSTNTTNLAGEVLYPGVEIPLPVGAAITFGTVRGELLRNAGARKEPV